MVSGCIRALSVPAPGVHVALCRTCRVQGGRMRDVGGMAREDRDNPAGHIGFAIEVIERLASRRQAGGGKLQQPLLDRLVAAVTTTDENALADVMEVFRRARIAPDVVSEEYIPAAACSLGAAWDEDRLGFGAVTIGTARLQSLLHLLQQDRRADMADPDGWASVLVLIPPGEQHTLGAMICAAKLRRKGVSVCLQVAPRLSDLSVLIAQRHFHAALVTIGGKDRVETCANLVKTLKQMTKGALPVAIGGPVAESHRVELMGIGADLVTSDVDTVISDFGLNGQITERNAG